MRKITHIVIHCSATPPGVEAGVKQIAEWHKARGFRTIGYHFVVRRSGLIEFGRPIAESGAHVKGYNSKSIGVCWEGGVGKDGKAQDNRTEEQRAALIALLLELRKSFPKAKIVGHRDLSVDLNGDGVISRNEWMKECPSFDAKNEYKDI